MFGKPWRQPIRAGYLPYAPTQLHLVLLRPVGGARGRRWVERGGRWQGPWDYVGKCATGFLKQSPCNDTTEFRWAPVRAVSNSPYKRGKVRSGKRRRFPGIAYTDGRQQSPLQGVLETVGPREGSNWRESRACRWAGGCSRSAGTLLAQASWRQHRCGSPRGRRWPRRGLAARQRRRDVTAAWGGGRNLAALHVSHGGLDITPATRPDRIGAAQ
eukprot:2369189-Pyramimonas_sp.AAC.2